MGKAYINVWSADLSIAGVGFDRNNTSWIHEMDIRGESDDTVIYRSRRHATGQTIGGSRSESSLIRADSKKGR